MCRRDGIARNPGGSAIPILRRQVIGDRGWWCSALRASQRRSAHTVKLGRASVRSILGGNRPQALGIADAEILYSSLPEAGPLPETPIEVRPRKLCRSDVVCNLLLRAASTNEPLLDSPRAHQ